MIARMILFIALFLPLSSSLQASWWDNVLCYFKGDAQVGPPAIRVLILHDAQNAKLEVLGKYSLYDPYANAYISSRVAGKSRLIESQGDGLKWGEAFPGIYQLKIKPDEPTTRTMINDKMYEGSVFIYDIGGTISIVNLVPVEDYVSALLAKYQDKTLEPETMAALAIIARTNAYYQAVNPKTAFWAVDAQKMGFAGKEPVSPNIEEAVRMTRFMVMSRTGVYEGGATPFAAQFDQLTPGASQDLQVSHISLEEANQMAQRGEHAALILGKAFPGTTIMHLQYGSSALQGQ